MFSKNHAIYDTITGNKIEQEMAKKQSTYRFAMV
jgi:hypothetical protein